MTERYINANDLQARLERKKAGIANQRYTEGWNDCMMRVKSMVSTAPAVDVAPVVHGMWVYVKTYYDIDECNCSLCGQLMTTAIDKRMNYCPNCGAKMDGDDNDDNI